jgi:hypothetical protein
VGQKKVDVLYACREIDVGIAEPDRAERSHGELRNWMQERDVKGVTHGGGLPGCSHVEEFTTPPTCGVHLVLLGSARRGTLGQAQADAGWRDYARALR